MEYYLKQYIFWLNSEMKKLTKIGEGVYGEVFKKKSPTDGVTIIKVGFAAFSVALAMISSVDGTQNVAVPD